MIKLITQDQDEMAQGAGEVHALIVSNSQSHSRVAGHATLPSMQESLAIREPVTAYIALGANLGDTQETVRLAMASIVQLPGVELISASSLYRTVPIESSGPDYINAVVKVSTTWSSYSLLGLLQKLEQFAGRERPYQNAPRTLDLDIVLYGSAQIESDVLTVPHPRMWQRAFVLVPLREIAPQLVSDTQWLAVSDQHIEKL